MFTSSPKATMTALDPTYPLYPIVDVLAAVMLLLVLTTSVVRHSWNLGVVFLSFWLSIELASTAASNIIWSDNRHRKERFHTFCDIFTRLQLVCYVVKPMSTLILSRRLYMIASLRPMEPVGTAARRWNLAVEWTLGLIVPLVVAGPLYYVVQDYRFVVKEGFGCASAHSHSVLSILLIEDWLVIPPLLSVLLYYPRVMKMFYRQRRDIERFLRSDHSRSVPHISYMRLLMLASVDIILMLPFGLTSIILYTLEPQPIPFFRSWPQGLHHHPTLHHHHTLRIKTVTYDELMTGPAGTARIARMYFLASTSPVLAFTIFGLFGLTAEARASYRRILCTIAGWFGWKAALQRGQRDTRSSLGPIEFGERPQTHVTLSDGAEIRSRSSLAYIANQCLESGHDEQAEKMEKVERSACSITDEWDITAALEEKEGSVDGG
ncbi:hypothetical protein PENSPDRAFT_298295 [Peniophora sp. CONT]|nr:hypothetical protein PENSPDRAFT_298295 [Peniophora sp. CONT]